MSRIYRYNLSGGEIGADLIYRSDLEHYHKANIIQEGFLSTPYGGVMRRPPTEKLTVHGPVVMTVNEVEVEYTPEVIRYFDFIYSRDTKYIAALISYRADEQNSFSRFEIYDPAGNLKDTVDCSYAALNFFELHVKQINDVMYITHNGYRPQQLVRNGDDDWALEDMRIKSGPFMDWNQDDNTTLSIGCDAYISTETYAEGDIVLSTTSNQSITGAEYVYWYQDGDSDDSHYKIFYLTRLTVADHGLSTGDTIIVSGFSGDAEPINGTYQVKQVSSSSTFDIYSGRYKKIKYSWETVYGSYIRVATTTWYNNYPLPSSFSAEKITVTGDSTFFVSLHDDNTGNSLPVSAGADSHWKRTTLPSKLNLQSSQDLFSEKNVGQKIYLTVQGAEALSGTFDATGEKSDLFVCGAGSVTLRTEAGVWGGKIRLQQTIDGGTSYSSLGVINGANGKHNGELTRDITDPRAAVRAYMETYSAPTGATGCMWQLEFPNGSSFIGEITEYINARTVSVKAQSSLITVFETDEWRLGAYSDDNGYPGTLAIHEERMLLGGTTKQPYRIDGSEINNWDQFAPGTLDTSSVTLQAQADRATQLCWMVSKDALLFGTDFSEFSAGQRDSDEVISAENPPKIQLQNTYSSAPIQPLLLRNEVLFIQNDYKTLRTFAYDSYAESGYIGENKTIYNPGIFGSGVKQMALQSNPFPVVWFVTNDAAGDLISFTYYKEMNIEGFGRHPLSGGQVESLCVLPTDADDEIILCVKRGDIFQMEKMSYANTVHTDDQGGTETAITSLLKPTSLLQNQEVLEEKKYKVNAVFLYLKESQGGQVSVDDGETWIDIEYPAAELFTGKVQVDVIADTTETAPLQIRTSGSQPFNLLAVGMDVTLTSTD